MAAHLREMLSALVAERLADLRRISKGGAHGLALDVEDTQRARLALLLRVLVEDVGVLVEPSIQSLHVGRAAVAIADRVELQLVARDAEVAQQRVVVLDHLGVDGGIGRADALQRELMVLAESAALRRRVAIHGREREELHRLGLAVQPVLDVRTADRRRALRPQRQRTAAAILEGVHLLLDDVGALTRRPLEELRVLEPGSLDAGVAVQRAQALHLPRHGLPQRLFGRKDVVRSARRLDARHARSSARKGFRSSSAPSVVSGPCPG